MLSRFRAILVALSLAAGLPSPGLADSAATAAPGPEALARAAQDKSPDRRRCHARAKGQDRFRDQCRAGPRRGHPVIVYADSHGTELAYALRQRARLENLRVTQVSGSACPPAIGFSPAMRPTCAAFTDTMLAAILDQPPSTIVMQANGELWQKEPNAAAFWTGYENAIEAIMAADHRVILLGPVPTHPGGALPGHLARLADQGENPQAYRFPVSGVFRTRVAPAVQAIAARQPVTYVPLAPHLCGSDAPTTCRAMTGRIVHYYDDHHLSVTKAGQLLDRVILPAIHGQVASEE